MEDTQLLVAVHRSHLGHGLDRQTLESGGAVRLYERPIPDRRRSALGCGPSSSSNPCECLANVSKGSSQVLQHEHQCLSEHQGWYVLCMMRGDASCDTKHAVAPHPPFPPLLPLTRFLHEDRRGDHCGDQCRRCHQRMEERPAAAPSPLPRVCQDHGRPQIRGSVLPCQEGEGDRILWDPGERSCPGAILQRDVPRRRMRSARIC